MVVLLVLLVLLVLVLVLLLVLMLVLVPFQFVEALHGPKLANVYPPL